MTIIDDINENMFINDKKPTLFPTYMEQITDLLDGGQGSKSGGAQSVNRARSSVRGASGHRGNQQ